MENLDELVSNYLKSDTNYAILITGEWGSGKTFYAKNKLFNIAKSLKTFGDDQKFYKPIIISLFGLNSVEQIQTKILFELFPILKNNGVKIGASILKSFASGMMKLGGFGELNFNLKEIDFDQSQLMNVNELVLCFDDLERIGKGIDYSEIIGYINSLVENNNAKVIIIANENKIDAKDYLNIKEKVIGISIYYTPNSNQVLRDIIELRYISYPKYQENLISNLDFILSLFNNANINFRIMTFALDKYHFVYSTIENIITDKSKLYEFIEEIRIDLLRFTISICVEFREGNMSFKNRKEIDYNPGIEMFDIVSWAESKTSDSSNESREKDFRELFINKYYKNHKYYYFDSIFNSITSGININQKKFVDELNDLYKIDNNQIPHYYEIFYILSDVEKVYKLTDREYINNTRQMLSYLDESKYELDKSILIFIVALRFNNPLHLNPENLEKRIIKSMRKRINLSEYDLLLDRKTQIDPNSKYFENLRRIKEKIIEINNTIRTRKLKEISNELEEECYSYFDKYLNKFSELGPYPASIPYLKYFNPNNFYKFFKKLNGSEKLKVIQHLEFRHHDVYNLDLVQELDFWKGLIKRISKHIKSGSNKGPTIALFIRLEGVIDRKIRNLTAPSGSTPY